MSVSINNNFNNISVSSSSESDLSLGLQKRLDQFLANESKEEDVFFLDDRFKKEFDLNDRIIIANSPKAVQTIYSTISKNCGDQIIKVYGNMFGAAEYCTLKDSLKRLGHMFSDVAHPKGIQNCFPTWISSVSARDIPDFLEENEFAKLLKNEEYLEEIVAKNPEFLISAMVLIESRIKHVYSTTSFSFSLNFQEDLNSILSNPTFQQKISQIPLSELQNATTVSYIFNIAKEWDASRKNLNLNKNENAN